MPHGEIDRDNRNTRLDFGTINSDSAGAYNKDRDTESLGHGTAIQFNANNGVATNVQVKKNDTQPLTLFLNEVVECLMYGNIECIDYESLRQKAFQGSSWNNFDFFDSADRAKIGWDNLS